VKKFFILLLPLFQVSAAAQIQVLTAEYDSFCFKINVEEVKYVLPSTGHLYKLPIFDGKMAPTTYQNLEAMLPQDKQEYHILLMSCVPNDGKPLLKVQKIIDFYAAKSIIEPKSMVIWCSPIEGKARIMFDFEYEKKPGNIEIAVWASCRKSELLSKINQIRPKPNLRVINIVIKPGQKSLAEQLRKTFAKSD